MKLSIIIVNYNVKHFLYQCLESVENAIKNIDSEIIVVDNNSTDGSLIMVAENFPYVKIIENKLNLGFSKANNQAIRIASGEYILLLNPDTLVQEDTFEKCINFLDNNPDGGALGVKMINGKGKFLPESKRGLPLPNVSFYKIFGLSKLFPKSKKFGNYYLTFLDNNKINPVEVLSGAFMLIRKSVLDKIGYLDEDYFMYGEDIDMSYRITQNGYKNYYYPETQIIHYKGESTKKYSLRYVYVFYRAMHLFVKKHLTTQSYLTVLIINIAIWARATLSWAKRILYKSAIPVIDIITIYVGLLLLSEYWEHAVLMYRNSTFAPIYRHLVIPLYVLIWIISIIAFKGYKKKSTIKNINKGIAAGTIFILLVYALLPEIYRFSRAVLVFGAGWITISLNILRYLYHKLKIKDFFKTTKIKGKKIIIGNKQSASKLADLLTIINQKLNKSNIVIIDKFTDLTNEHINEIEEIFFCKGEISINNIISIMQYNYNRHVDFIIVDLEKLTFIGSQSILAPEK